jgi:hypothetical protein
MVLTPDGKNLIVSQMGGAAHNPDGETGITFVNLATRKHRFLRPEIDARPGWGDSKCTPSNTVSTHGIGLSRRSDGRLQLLVVNHAGRESIEFYEVNGTGTTSRLTWRGCVENPSGLAFNDVVPTKAGFIATIPDGKLAPAKNGMIPLDGTPTGYLVEWTTVGGIAELPGSRGAYNNGVQLSADESIVYFAAWTGRQVQAYDRRMRKIVATATLTFHPDNISTRADGTLIAAGVTDLAPFLPCIRDGDNFCPSGFGVAAVDPKTMQVAPLFTAAPGLLPGASVAVQTGRTLYVGAFMGNRVLAVALRP